MLLNGAVSVCSRTFGTVERGSNSQGKDKPGSSLDNRRHLNLVLRLFTHNFHHFHSANRRCARCLLAWVE